MSDLHRALANEEFFTRLGQTVIRLLDAPTEEGFGWRVDMRLRPFGDSGPLVASFAAFEDYLQIHGRDWERYAWIKARAITGAEAYGKNLFIGFGSDVNTELLVHVHLGLIGKIRLGPAVPVAAGDTLRLRIDNGEQAAELRGPQTCALITPAEQAGVTAALGPDPLTSTGGESHRRWRACVANWIRVRPVADQPRLISGSLAFRRLSMLSDQ